MILGKDYNYDEITSNETRAKKQEE
jgi:hypothetical protein